MDSNLPKHTLLPHNYMDPISFLTSGGFQDNIIELVIFVDSDLDTRCILIIM